MRKGLNCTFVADFSTGFPVFHKVQHRLLTSSKLRLWCCIFILLTPVFSFSQISVLPVPPACEGQNIQLTAVVNGIYGTESYSFEQFPYSPEPYTGGTAVVMTDDDVYPDNSTGLPIGFPFCFLNSSVDYFWIGSNGWISFLPNQPTTYLPTALPDPGAPKSAIFAPWQDWDPGVGPQAAEGYIFYRTEGVPPNRKLIVYWRDCPMYNCNTLYGRFQIVIHESTNIIDNHIARKPDCNWQGNTATQGIQNATGTAPVYIAFGRNQNSWEVLPGQEESTHFVPSGITWHEGTPTGPIVGTGDIIHVIATVSTTYWAVLAACDNSGNYQASVNVIVNPIPVPTFLSGDIVACQGDIKTYTTEPGNNHYNWVITGGIPATGAGGGANDPWIGVQWTTPGANSITISYISPEGCEALIPAIRNVTVNAFEVPVITTIADEFCPETEVTFTTQAGMTNYLWDYAASGATYVAGGTTADNFIILKWSLPGPKTIFVNYTDAGCTGDPPGSKQITIKPVPSVDLIIDQEYCNIMPAPSTIINGPVANTTYTWTNSNTNIGLSPGGTGNIPAFTTTNTGLVPISATITIIPEAGGCIGLPSSYNIVVNPVPMVNPLTDQIYCNNGPASSTAVGGPVTGALYSWTNSNTNIGLVAGGTGNIPAFIATNPGSSPISATIAVIAAANGCTGPSSSYQIVVNPTPTVAPIPDQPACNNDPVPSTLVAGPVGGATYTWTNSNTNIGLAAGGTGNIPAFTAANSGTATISATIAITPEASGCTGISSSYTIVVYPTPTIIPITDQAYCNNEPASAITIGSPVAGASYTWTNSNTNIGLAGSGTGDIPAFTASNPGSVPVSATITLVPVANTCAGNSSSYNIIVNPTPAVNFIPDQPFCHNQPAPLTLVNGTVGNSTYSWSNSNTSIGLAAAGSGSIPSFIAQNGGSSPVNAYISIVPSANGCFGSSTGYTITVNPLPVPQIFGPNSVCTGSAGVVYNTNPGMIGYQWAISSGGTITSGQLTDAVTTTWNTIGPQTLSVNYTDGNGCTTPVSSTYNISVQTLPVPTITSGDNAVCAGQVVTYFTQPGATTYAWGYPPIGVTRLSGGDIHDDFIELRWDIANGYDISVNYSIGIGCTAVNPTIFHVTVHPNPVPLITGPSGPVCGFSTQTYSTSGGPGHTYSWTATGGTPAGGGGPNNNTINVLWGNALPVSVDLAETSHYPGVSCTAQAPTLFPVFKSWPDAAGAISGPTPVCNQWTGQVYTVPIIANASNYDWSYSGSGATTSISGNSVTINFSANATSGLLTVKGQNDCGYGPGSPPFAITVNPVPIVSYNLCNDAVTTKNAKPFILKGGQPYGTTGTYHLNNPAATSLAGNLLDPGDPAVLIGFNTIYYTYTNVNNCKATAQQIISVLPSNSNLICFGHFTDPRDTKIYKIIQIGAQCWMQENLRYASVSIPFDDPQTDNCLVERNCLAGDPDCLLNGGFYQWDELMQYNAVSQAQGLCPPGWHIPDEAEWDILIAAVSGGTGNGTAGSFMKDINLSSSFQAEPAGIFYLNNLQSFTTSYAKATFFWTSTINATASLPVARGLNSKTPSVSRYESSSANAFPVRCVKD